MKQTLTRLLAANFLFAAACAPAPAGEAAKEAATASADAAIVTPTDAPKIASNDPLYNLTCADFLGAAEVATTVPADDAALAAQDEIAFGLHWLHGYHYAKTDGKIEPLSRDWMAKTAKRVYDACSKVEKPEESNLSALVKP
jgi:hypothetical protein